MITGFGSTLWAASRMVLLTASTGGVGEPATSASKEPITTKVAPRGGLLADRPDQRDDRGGHRERVAAGVVVATLHDDDGGTEPR